MSHLADHPWRPVLDWSEEVYLQWGGSGLVLEKNSSRVTAFVEAFPTDGSSGFIRGEGSNLEEAEAQAFEMWRRQKGCFEAGGHAWGRVRKRERGVVPYTNGGCFCRRCGSFSTAMPPIVKLGDYRAPLSCMELDSIISGFLAGNNKDKSSRKWARRIFLRARLAGIQVPDEPEIAPDPFDETDAYHAACRAAVAAFLRRCRDNPGQVSPLDSGGSDLFSSLSRGALRRLLDEDESVGTAEQSRSGTAVEQEGTDIRNESTFTSYLEDIGEADAPALTEYSLLVRNVATPGKPPTASFTSLFDEGEDSGHVEKAMALLGVEVAHHVVDWSDTTDRELSLDDIEKMTAPRWAADEGWALASAWDNRDGSVILQYCRPLVSRRASGCDHPATTNPSRQREGIEAALAERLSVRAEAPEDGRKEAGEWYEEIRACVFDELRAGAVPVKYEVLDARDAQSGWRTCSQDGYGAYQGLPHIKTRALFTHPPVPREAELGDEHAKLREYYAAAEDLSRVGLFNATPAQFKRMDDARTALAAAPETRG